jgi:hypothetical protein
MYAIGKSVADAEKKQKQERAAFKRKFKENDRRHQLKLAQANFNKYIRLRDVDNPCISCQRHHKGKLNAGHYRTVKAMPELRFNELNVHGQCEPCNSYLSGNITEYRINLVKKIGADKVEWLEAHHEHKKLTVDQIIEIKKLYAQKARDLEKRLEAAA